MKSSRASCWVKSRWSIARGTANTSNILERMTQDEVRSGSESGARVRSAALGGSESLDSQVIRLFAMLAAWVLGVEGSQRRSDVAGYTAVEERRGVSEWQRTTTCDSGEAVW